MIDKYNRPVITLPCDCVGTCGVIRIVVDEETKKDAYISIYKQRDSKVPLGLRLKHIWRVLRYGTPYEDDIVLRSSDLESLVEFLKAEVNFD